MTLRAYARWCRHYEGFYQLLFNQLFRCILTIIEKKNTTKNPRKIENACMGGAGVISRSTVALFRCRRHLKSPRVFELGPAAPVANQAAQAHSSHAYSK
jgi:hypothetical protein